MPVYGYVWLCMAMYDHVSLCMNMYGYVWLCMKMYDLVWLCMAIYEQALNKWWTSCDQVMNKSEKIDEHNKSANSWANHDQTMIKPCAQVTSTSWKSQEHVMQNYEQVMNMTWTSREKRMDNRWTMSVHDIKTLRFFLCHHCFSWKVIQSGQKPRGYLTANLKPPGSNFLFSVGIWVSKNWLESPIT